jgi:molybdopterin converting factor small subunit
MKIHVKYTAQLRTALQRAEESVELPEASSLAALLTHLADRDPAGRPHLLSGAGLVNACLLVVVNESAVSAGDATSVALQEGDVVLLLPPIAGG